MKSRLLTLLLIVLLLVPLGFAQRTLISSQTYAAANGVASGPGLYTSGQQAGTYVLTWVASGTVSTCTVQIETSSNNTSYSLMTGSSAKTCTSTGSYTYSGGVTATWVRFNITALSGTGSVVMTLQALPATPVPHPVQTVFLATDYTNATTTFSDVTGLGFRALANSNYQASCYIVWQGSAGTTGPKYQFTGPGSPTAVAVGMLSTVTATTVTHGAAVAFSSAVANAGTITTGTNFPDVVTLGVLNGANAGAVQLQAAANGAGTLTIKAGSYCVVQ